jgi:hypothetical protein
MTASRKGAVSGFALLLAGCFGGPPPASLPVVELKVGFPPGGLADVIVIDAADRLPLHSAELIAPDGAATASTDVLANQAPLFATGQYAATDPWKTGLTGGAGRETISAGQTGAALRTQAKLLSIVSNASIPLPDPPAYRRDWQHYRIRLQFGLPPGEVETREIAAPEPPPPAPGPPA